MPKSLSRHFLTYKNTITKLLDIISKLQGEQTEEDIKKIEEEERLRKITEEIRSEKWKYYCFDEPTRTHTFINKYGEELKITYEEMSEVRRRLCMP